MQTRRLARGPGAWTPSGSDGSGRIQPSGPTNLDLYAKDALHKLLKPCNYPAVMPWINEASTSEKRDVVKLAELSASGGSGVKHPQSWLQAPQQATATNDRGRTRIAGAQQISGDRLQHDLLKNKCGFDKRDPHKEKRRQFFQSWTDIPSVDSVGDFFHLKDNPVQANPIASVLTESARRGLQRWQISGPEQGMGTAANAMRALRSVHDAVKRIPQYKEHLREQRPGAQGARDLLHDYGTICPRGSRTLMGGPYARPDRYLVHSSSSPAILKPIVGPDMVEKISLPGGYVVALNDVVPLATLKNRERNNSSNVGSVGGSQEYSTSSNAVGLHSLHA